MFPYFTQFSKEVYHYYYFSNISIPSASAVRYIAQSPTLEDTICMVLHLAQKGQNICLFFKSFNLIFVDLTLFDVAFTANFG